MENLTCKKCGGELKFNNNCIVCTNCGEIYSLISDEEEIENNESEYREENILEEKQISNRKSISKLIGMSIPFLLILLCIWIFSGATPTNKVEKVLKENNYNDLQVVETRDLGSDVEGLNGNNLLVLLKGNTNGTVRYAMGAVNVKEKTVTDIAFRYGPLNIIIDKVFLSNEKMNLSNLDCAVSFICDYGFGCFENQEYAEKYIRLITGENGIIDVKTARQAIIDSISYILPDIHSSPDFYVVFEDGNANPTHYAALSSEMRYNWTHIFPENVYNVWKANTDRSTQSTMIALYGQPYVQKEVWAVVDKNLQPVGTYNSLDAVKEIFEKGTSPTNKNNEDEVEDDKKISTDDEKDEENISQTNTKIVVGTNACFPPFEDCEKDEIVGFDIDLIELICQELGYEYEIKDMDFDALLPALTQNKVDLVISGFIATEERREICNFTIPYIEYDAMFEDEIQHEAYSIAIRKGDPMVNDINECIKRYQNDGTINRLKEKWDVEEVS